MGAGIRSPKISVNRVWSNVTLVAAGSFHNIISTTDNGLYIFGDAYCGDGTINVCTAIQADASVRKSYAGSATKFIGGFSSTFIMTNTLQIYSLGDNTFNQLGSSTPDPRFYPEEIDSLYTSSMPINQLECTRFCVALGSDMLTIFTWGDNTKNQLGNVLQYEAAESAFVDLPSFGVADSNNLILKGRHDTMVLYNGLEGYNAKIVSWGSNFYGTIGDNSFRARRSPVSVDISVSGVKDFDVSQHATLLSMGEIVFAWGENLSNQISTKSLPQPSPIPIPIKRNISEMNRVMVGCSHTLLWGDTSILALGNNLMGQLGANSTKPILAEFSPVVLSHVLTKPDSVLVDVAIGCDHNLILTSTNQLWAWGDGELGNLGNGEMSSSSFPVPVDMSPFEKRTIVFIGAGSEYSLATTEDNSIFIWGKLNPRKPLLVPTKIDTSQMGSETIYQISVGLEHTALLTRSGRVFTFGSNSNRQLGDGTIINRDTPIAATLIEKELFKYSVEVIMVLASKHNTFAVFTPKSGLSPSLIIITSVTIVTVLLLTIGAIIIIPCVYYRFLLLRKKYKVLQENSTLNDRLLDSLARGESKEMRTFFKVDPELFEIDFKDLKDLRLLASGTSGAMMVKAVW